MAWPLHRPVHFRRRYRENDDTPTWRRAESSPSDGARALRHSPRNGSEARMNGRLERWATCEEAWRSHATAPPRWRRVTTRSCGPAIAAATWRPSRRTFLQTCSCHGRPQRVRPSCSAHMRMAGRELSCCSRFRPQWPQQVRYALVGSQESRKGVTALTVHVRQCLFVHGEWQPGPAP